MSRIYEIFIMQPKRGYVYIIANDRPTLYTGVTSNLVQRVYQHKNNVMKGFTSKYRLYKLVYYQTLETIEQAIIREKQIKDMNRFDKLEIIKKANPTFKDLYNSLIG